MKKPVTYLLIKSSVLSVTDQQKPSLDGVTSAAQFKRLNDFFNDSFIKVDNPEVLDNVERNSRIFRLRIDGLYPVDGIEFEVTCKWKGNLDSCGNETCWDLQCCQKSPSVAVVSLVDAKEKEQSGEPGNEAKKEPIDVDKAVELMLNEIDKREDCFIKAYNLLHEDDEDEPKLTAEILATEDFEDEMDLCELYYQIKTGKMKV